MKKMKRMIALLLTVLMVVSALPVVSLADDDVAAPEAVEAAAEPAVEPQEELPAEDVPAEVPTEQTETVESAEAVEPEAAETGEIVLEEEVKDEQLLGLPAPISCNGNGYANILAAYNGEKNNMNPVVIILNEDVTLNGSDTSNGSHYISSPSKSITIDLNGFTLTDATGKNLCCFNGGYDNLTFTLTSSVDGGKYVKSGARGIIAFGTSSITKAQSLRRQDLIVSDIEIDASGSTASLIASNSANFGITLSNVTIDHTGYTASGAAMISTQCRGTWTSDMDCYWDLTLENVDYTGKCFSWYSGNQNGSATPLSNYHFTVKLGGTNTIRYNSAADGGDSSYGAYYGLYYKKMGGTVISWDTLATALDSRDKLTVDTSVDKTVTAIATSYYVYWDLDGDGEEDEEAMHVAYNANPTHANPDAPAGKIFAGWTDLTNSEDYNAGDTLPTPEDTGEITLYSARFIDAPNETAEVKFEDYDGSELQAAQTVYVGTAPIYSGSEPTRANNGATVYTFSGWTDNGGETVFTSLPVLTSEQKDTTITYTAVYNETTMPFAYVSSTDVTTYYDSLVGAYTNGLLNDEGQGTIMLLQDWTLADDDHNSTNHVLQSPTKDVVIDLNGYTLTNDSNRNLIYGDQDGFDFTLKSSGAQGTYVQTNKIIVGSTNRNMVAIGGTSVGAVYTDRAISVTVENVHAVATKGSLFASYLANPTFTIRNCQIESGDVLFSIQASSKWDSATKSNPTWTFENVTYAGRGVIWCNRFSRGGAVLENMSATINLVGNNVFKTNSANYKNENGFRMFTRYASDSDYDVESMIDPANGYVVEQTLPMFNDITLNGTEQDDGDYWTVTANVITKWTVAWDTDGDGVVDDTTYYKDGETVSHAAGAKDPVGSTVYTFAGWSDGTDTYSADAIPEATADVTYTAQFDEETVTTTHTIRFEAENGSELYSDSYLEGLQITYPNADPTKADTDTKSYDFAGWKLVVNNEVTGEAIATANLPTATADATYRATFTEYDLYTVTFTNENDSQLQTGKVRSGETPVFSGEEPTKAPDAENAFVFAGWLKNGAGDPVTDLTAETVTDNVTYKASFETVMRPWQYVASDTTVSFYDTLTAALTAFMNDSGSGTIVQMADYTITAAEAGSGDYLLSVTKDFTLDLNGHTLTYDAAKRIMKIAASVTVIVQSTAAQGTIEYTTDNHMIYVGADAAGQCEIAPELQLINLNINGSTGTSRAMLMLRAKHPSIVLEDCFIKTAGNFISFSASKTNWNYNDPDVSLSITMKDTTIYNQYMFIVPNNTATPVGSFNGSLDFRFAGSNKIYYYSTNAAAGACWGVRFNKSNTTNATDSNVLNPASEDYACSSTAPDKAITVTHNATADATNTFYGSTDAAGYYCVTTTETPLHTITWDTDGDGVVDDTTYYENGAAVTHTDGAKDPVGSTVYTFTGWSDGTNTYAADAIPSATADAAYTAQFSSQEVTTTYTVRFETEIGTELYSNAFLAGLKITYPNDDPTKADTDTKSYDFAGWKLVVNNEVTGEAIATANLPTATADATYRATFTEFDLYTVSFVNHDDTPLASVKVRSGNAPVYEGEEPTRAPDGEIAYAFVGWLKNGAGDPITDLTAETVTDDVTYKASFSAFTPPFAYIASNSTVTYYESLVDAYEKGRCNDDGQGTIVLMKDWTLADDDHNSDNHVLQSPTKDVILDLNGYTLTNDSNRNLIYADQDGFDFTMTSSGAQGGYVQTNKAVSGSTNRNMVAIGGTSVGAVYTDRAISVTVENVHVVASKGSLFASYLANPTYTIRNSDLESADVAFSIQASSNWTANTVSNPTWTFENVTYAGRGTIWCNRYTRGKAVLANMSATIYLIGTNVFKTNNNSYKNENGFRMYTRYASDSDYDVESMIDPANGYIGEVDGIAPIITLNGSTPDDGSYYTVSTISGIPIYWDTNGDGTYDSVTGFNQNATPNPTHEDGEKAFDEATKTVYTFIGWRNVESDTFYAKGETLPAATAETHYVAEFDAQSDDEITAAYETASGFQYVKGDIQELLQTYGATAKSFKILTDYTLTAELNLYGVPVLDLGGHTVTGNYGVAVPVTTEIRNGTLNVTASAAIKQTGGDLTLTDVNVLASEIGIDVQSGRAVITGGSVIAGLSRGSGFTAIRTAAGTAVAIDGATLATGSADAPLLSAAGAVVFNTFKAYIADAYYTESDTWYQLASTGSISINTWVVERATQTVPGTDFTGYHAVAISSPAARIGTTYFETLVQAVNAVGKSGGTIILLKDTDLDAEKAAANGAAQLYYVNSGKGAVTIDFNGFTVKSSNSSRTFTLTGKNPITFKNGNLDFSDQGNATSNYGIMMGTASSTLRMIDMNMNIQIRGIYLSTADVNKVVEISGGSYTMTNNSTASAGIVVFSINATTPRTAGNTLRISNNAKFSRTGAPFAIFMTNLDTCEIKSADFSVKADGTVLNNGTITFIDEANMTKAENPSAGTYVYTTGAELNVASFNGTGYTTLAAAINAANSAGGGTVTLLKSVSEKLNGVQIPSSVKIDQNGYKLTILAESTVNGFKTNSDLQIDTSLNLKAVSLTLTDPAKINLKYARNDCTVVVKASDTQHITSCAESRNGNFAYSFELSDFTTEYLVYAAATIDGVQFSGIPQKVSVARIAAAAAEGSKLKALANALLGTPTTVDAYEAATAGVMTADGLTLNYEGAKTPAKIEFIDVYGIKHTSDEATISMVSYANLLQTVTITADDGTTETDTMLNALKKAGKPFEAVYGYFAAKYFGN